MNQEWFSTITGDTGTYKYELGVCYLFSKPCHENSYAHGQCVSAETQRIKLIIKTKEKKIFK